MNNTEKGAADILKIPAGTGTAIKEIELENGQTLVLSDLSRKISTDAYVVVMQAAIEISVTPGTVQQGTAYRCDLRADPGSLGR